MTLSRRTIQRNLRPGAKLYLPMVVPRADLQGEPDVYGIVYAFTNKRKAAKWMRDNHPDREARLAEWTKE